MLYQTVWGCLGGLANLFFLYIAYVLFRVGRFIGESEYCRASARPRLKAAMICVVVSVVLGGLASRASMSRGPGDGMFDPGDIIEVEENPAPAESFAEVMITCLGCTLTGLLTNEKKQGGQ